MAEQDCSRGLCVPAKPNLVGWDGNEYVKWSMSIPTRG